MAKTNADRQREYRERQKAIGRLRRVKYLTDSENKSVDKFITKMRRE